MAAKSDRSNIQAFERGEEYAGAGDFQDLSRNEQRKAEESWSDFLVDKNRKNDISE